MTDASTLERRLARFRASLRAGDGSPHDGRLEPVRRRRPDLARAMASAVDGEVVAEDGGVYVRFESPAVPMPLDRVRLAALPRQAPAAAPLVCLDTETTGLGTAAGTYAFLVGLGWWEGDAFRTVQLLLPDQPAEAALLGAVERHIPTNAWLVSYNGRGFDWPLLETRYRMARRPAPVHAGHLDLLPLVRRLFRHRLPDARLRTVEEHLLGLARHEDVEGWEIPGRYLDFLRTGLAEPLIAVVRHNGEDVRSLGRLLAHLDTRFGDQDARRAVDPGDAAGLARLFLRDRRLDEALACLESALASAPGRRAGPLRSVRETPGTYASRAAAAVDDWWSPRRRADFGGRPQPPRALSAPAVLATPWSEERLLVERAHVLRRLARVDDAAATWADLATGTSRLAAVAAVELAKLREHRLGDLAGALDAVGRGWTILDRRRRLGRPEPAVEADLVRRGRRLTRRLAATRAAAPVADPLRSTTWSGSEGTSRVSASS